MSGNIFRTFGSVYIPDFELTAEHYEEGCNDGRECLAALFELYSL